MERIPQRGDLGENRKAADELRGFKGGHADDLFDMTEDTAGERFDLATGKPIDNTRPDSIEGKLRIIASGTEDVLPPLREKDDDAAKWLREHGGK